MPDSKEHQSEQIESEGGRAIVIRRSLIGCLLLATVLLSTCLFSVWENESVIVTRFGRPVRVISDAGLNFRLPWPAESLHRLDTRVETLDVRISETLTRDKRNVVVPVFAIWKITDPLKFLKALGKQETARARLDAVLTSSRNAVLGKYDFHQLVSTESAEVKLEEIEQSIRDLAHKDAHEHFGISVEEVGIKQLTLPEANTEFVFRRMRAERAKYAAQYRAEGRKTASGIRARTDSEKTTILAEAKKYAAIKRGEAEAEATRIYTVAHSKDPEFYGFLRELQALRHIVDRNTTLVLDMDEAPFRALKADSTENFIARKSDEKDRDAAIQEAATQGNASLGEADTGALESVPAAFLLDRADRETIWPESSR